MAEDLKSGYWIYFSDGRIYNWPYIKETAYFVTDREGRRETKHSDYRRFAHGEREAMLYWVEYLERKIASRERDLAEWKDKLVEAKQKLEGMA